MFTFPISLFGSSAAWNLYNGANNVPLSGNLASLGTNATINKIDNNNALLLLTGTSDTLQGTILKVDASGHISFATYAGINSDLIFGSISSDIVSSTRAILAYPLNGTPRNLNILTMDFDSTTIISVGTAVQPQPSNFMGVTTKSNCIGLTALSSTEALVSFWNQDDAKLYCYDLTINSDGSIAINTGIVLETGVSFGNQVTSQKVSSNQVLVTYISQASGVQLNVISKLITVTSNVPSVTTTLNVSSSLASALNMRRIGTTNNYLVVYAASTPKVEAVIVNISGSTLTAGTAVRIANIEAREVSVSCPTNTFGMILYSNSSSGSHLESFVVGISGTVLTTYSAVELFNSTTRYPYVEALSPTTVLAAYRNNSSVGQLVTLKP